MTNLSASNHKFAVVVSTHSDHAPSSPAFHHELRDFLRFLVRAKLSPRLPFKLSFKRLFQWVLALWAINLLVMGPIALLAAESAGAQHRLNLNALPWLHALIWAPLVEELVFRYGLRQPVKALWLLPLTTPALLMGPSPPAALLLGFSILLCCWLHGRSAPTRWTPSLRWHKTWCQHFGWVMHASCLAFAALHLHNFSLQSTPLWILPLLVTPQWVTGLVLAWLRVRRNLMASIALHALFNGGPLLLLYGALRLLQPSAVG